MNVLVFDHDCKALTAEQRMLNKLLPQAEIVSFHTAIEAAVYAEGHKVDMALLDVAQEDYPNSVMLQALKKQNPFVQIICCCGISAIEHEYSREYLRKPISEKKLSELLTLLAIPHNVPTEQQKK